MTGASVAVEPARAVVLAGLRAAIGTLAVDDSLAMATPDIWGDVVSLAEAEGVAPLLYSVWRDSEAVPAAHLARLRAAYIQTGSRNTLLERDLATVLPALRDADLSCVVLKGAALVATVYHNPALRPMVDIDLLVPPEAVDRAITALATVGYTPRTAELAPGTRIAYDNEVALRGPAALSTPIELHWSLFDSPYYQRHLDMRWYWQSTEPCRLARCDVLVLGPAAQLLHLAAHWALHHPGDALLWQHDIASLLMATADRMDWPTVLAQTAAQDLVLPLQAALASSTRRWGVPIADDVAERLATLTPSDAERRALALLNQNDRDVAHRLSADVAGIAGWRRKAHFLARQLVPSPSYMRARYGIDRPSALPAAYLRRWWRGLLALVRGR